MTKIKQQKLIKIILLFILLQPLFDIISFLSIRDIISFNISTYFKPLFVFSIAFYMLFWYSPLKKKWFVYIFFFLLFLVGHFYLLFNLLVPMATVLHEFRFVLNIVYMIAMFMAMLTIYYHYEDKEELLAKIKKTLMFTMLIYGILLLISVLFGTSAMTYEYSDKNKLGFKGWFDSGQILGHALSVLFPILLYTVLRPQQKWYVKIGYLSLLIIMVSLLGTKVPYYIVFIVLILYLVISLGIKIINKEFKCNYFNIIVVFISVAIMTFTYQYTPVAYNTELNRKNANISLDFYDMGSIDGSKNVKSFEDLIKENTGSDVTRLVEYNQWNIEASNYLASLFEQGVVHPSNMRSKQFFYSLKKFQLSSLEYKVFGIGYLNQEDTLAIESDFFMAFFCFGILGFLLILTLPIFEFLKATVFILKNIKKVDLETYLLYMGLGIFFCISIYAGYTYIYTNFSIYLVMLIIMLKSKIDIIKKEIKKDRKIKSIDFLLLHLGYGGIESSTINSANALCKKYDVKIISFYKLEKNQVNKLNKNISIEYLYNGSPNREKFKKAVKSFEIISILREGFKAASILIKKKLLVIRYIRKCKSDAIVSTRVEFNVLLSKFGKFDTLKIAQEHHYHNNDKKYINKIRNCYYGIDYLCALTSTLKNDYEKFLKNNVNTEVILLPNMISELPKVRSDLRNKNIITVSRLDYGKKNDDIIRAFSKISDKESRLYIIGDGAEFNNLKALIEELDLGDRVIMTGYLDKSNIEKYMINSSIFLMASLTEGLPMVLLETMSYGVPCIAYETASGVNDIIDDGVNGFVIKDRNEEEYVNKISLLINDTKKRDVFGKNSFKKVNDFYKTNVIKIWERMLK